MVAEAVEAAEEVLKSHFDSDSMRLTARSLVDEQLASLCPY